MDLEEHTLESAKEQCEECGVELTDREIELALERGGPSLCTVHATESLPLEDAELDEPAP